MNDDKIKMMGEPQNYERSGEVSGSALLTCSIDNGPLTAMERVDRLFLARSSPTHEEIYDAIRDAEFDTLNFPEIIAKRHGQ